MAILDYSKLSQEQIDALPCVCCGNPLGTLPCSDSYWICPYCWWEEETVQFRLSWQWGGPNYFALWQSRRHYELAGISDGPFMSPDLIPDKPPEEHRYDWDLDPRFYSDYAVGSRLDPVPNTLNVLRCHGLFSARQIRQKLVKRREIFEPGATYRFPHIRILIIKFLERMLKDHSML